MGTVGIIGLMKIGVVGGVLSSLNEMIMCFIWTVIGKVTSGCLPYGVLGL